MEYTRWIFVCRERRYTYNYSVGLLNLIYQDETMLFDSLSLRPKIIYTPGILTTGKEQDILEGR